MQERQHGTDVRNIEDPGHLAHQRHKEGFSGQSEICSDDDACERQQSMDQMGFTKHFGHLRLQGMFPYTSAG